MNQTDIINAVDRMQNYIDSHLRERITLARLAKAAGYSPWHSARIFKELTGKTPFDYIRTLRLSKAALMLRDKDFKIIDVALDFVFDSHEGFTRAFSKEFGLSPKAYSRKTPPVKLFMPSSVRAYHQFLLKGETQMEENKTTKTVFVQVIERPRRKALILRGKNATDYFEYCEEMGCDVWGMLTSVKEALYEPVGMWLPKKLIKPGTSEYVQGVELPLDYSNSIPEGYELIELEPCKMMIFQGEPYDDENFEAEITAVWDCIDKYDPTIYGFEWAPDDAPRFQLAPMGYRGYIEGRPVKALNDK